ncbi:DUF1775 domain-containing protein [Acrocarpospora phusangensis]|uniref:DUF1775 domain-containing protein n=1 Tax=Acrocarpospora phusangensis TaxID=1070424 RepID=UPI001EF27470|nr:DUF1775 domain-containing protein [Acrocarpospora phusangensis]
MSRSSREPRRRAVSRRSPFGSRTSGRRVHHPTRGHLSHPTRQTYSSGEVVTWADPPAADGSEPEHPAPTLKLVEPAGEGGHHGTAATTPAAAPASAAPTASAAGHGSSAASSAGTADGTARLLAGVGIAVGIVGVGVGILGLRRSRAQ